MVPGFQFLLSCVRYVCVDLGDKRTGLACGDTVTGVVTAVKVVEVSVGLEGGRVLVRELAREVRALGAGALVVGLPINMDDSEGPRAKKVRGLGDALGKETGLGVFYQDERLTSADADWQMARTGMTRGEKKQRRDALAAATILRDFLAELARKASNERNEERGTEEVGG